MVTWAHPAQTWVVLVPDKHDDIWQKSNTGDGNIVHCSVVQLCLTLCDSMDYSMPGLPVLHHLPEFAQIHAH